MFSDKSWETYIYWNNLTYVALITWSLKQPIVVDLTCGSLKTCFGVLKQPIFVDFTNWTIDSNGTNDKECLITLWDRSSCRSFYWATSTTKNFTPNKTNDGCNDKSKKSFSPPFWKKLCVLLFWRSCNDHERWQKEEMEPQSRWRYLDERHNPSVNSDGIFSGVTSKSVKVPFHAKSDRRVR